MEELPREALILPHQERAAEAAKIERLRGLRLAKEAADRVADQSAAPAPRKSPRARR